jgi:hypothetical protein
VIRITLRLKGGVKRMTLPGECVNAEETKCYECGTSLFIEVCQSAAGYYVGFMCYECEEPYSRESGYYNTKAEAQEALDNKTYTR